MSDQIIVKNEATKFAVHPAGQYTALCVDVIDMGEKIEQYMSNPPRPVRKVTIIFQSEETNPDTGKPFELSVERTLSFGPKASLRKFLGDWRGKAYTDEEADAGVPLHKLVGVPALVTVDQKVSAGGRTYANVLNAVPLPRQMPRPVVKDYTRHEYWAKKKGEYKADADKFRGAQEPAPDQDFSDFDQRQPDEDADSSLPF